MFEALLLGLIGGLVGCLMALPFNGVSAGTMNFQTFTEMAFAFRVTPVVLARRSSARSSWAWSAGSFRPCVPRHEAHARAAAGLSVPHLGPREASPDRLNRSR
jgi:hypothetical protein